MEYTSDVVRERARRVIQGVLADEVGFARWVKHMVAHTVTEYRGRFIHELVQNGYDAHPAGTTDGRIATHFDETEGDYGVLYVANGGSPLSEVNFDRMASLADSNKEIGVGIGNKGIGFKSVFQICQVPEVYSAAGPDDPGVSGFTFRFGTRQDLVEELGGDEELADRVEENLSLSLLTVPLTEIPAAVSAYRGQGYVTIVRLPAVSAAAAAEIRERIERLLGSPAPLMLFLERLESLSVKASHDAEPLLLTRRVVPGERDEPWQRVDLGDVSFRLFTEQVDPGRLRAALEESVEKGTLDARWLDWDSDAFVSVAVADGPAVTDSRLFTYLPMGEEALSPLNGHLNAPFVTNLARVGLDHEQPVNRLLIERVAELCLDAAAVIAERDGDANTCVDLLAWQDRVEVLAETCRRTRGRELADVVVLPTRRGGWRPLTETRIWDQDDTQVITARALAADCGAILADADRLDDDRLDAAAELAGTLDLSLDPDDLLTAEWTEMLAAALHDRGTAASRWAEFYDDLPRIFESGEALAGRLILFAADNTLARCNEPVAPAPAGSGRRTRQRSVFFSPRVRGDRPEPDDATDDSLTGSPGDEGESVDIRPPRSLSSRITFLHPDLDWYAGSQRRPGREFLESHHLVQPYRTERLLGLMARVMSESPSDALKRDCLYYAFRLLGAQPDRHARDLKVVGLHVPTQSGSWIPATSARFSGAWSAVGADDLTHLASAATDETPELASLHDLLVADPTDFPGGVETTARWQAFLETLGLTTTLPIQSAVDTRTISGRHLTTARLTGFAVPVGVPEGVAEQWRQGLDAAGNWSHPDTEFTTNDRLFWFLGQHEIGLLPARFRLGYALLVVRTLSTLRPEHRVSTWRRRNPYGNDSSIRTPLACFLENEEWVPNRRGSAEPAFRRPGHSWYVAIEDQMAAYYSPLVDVRLRRVLESLPNPRSAMRSVGLRIWGSPEDAAALIDHLTELVGAREISDGAAADHVRFSLADAWNDLGPPPSLARGLVVERHGQLELLEADAAGAVPVFVTGVRDTSTTAKLVRELGWPVLPVNSDNRSRLRGLAERVLRPDWHDDVVVTPDWDIEVLADGRPWRPDPDAALLTTEVPWLPLAVACTMRFPRSATPVGKNLERHLDDLARVRLVRSVRLSIATAGGEQALPERLHGVLPVPGDVPTLLVESGGETLVWSQLEHIAAAALELMGQARFTAELALSLQKLATDPGMPVVAPDRADVADAVGIEAVRVAELESRVYGSVSVALERLLPSAVYLWGERALSELPVGSAASREDVLAALTQLSKGDHAEAERVLRCASEATDANGVRLALSVPLPDFNAVLERYFLSMPPVDNSRPHLEEFELRRTQRRAELLNWLRAVRLPEFEAGRPQPDWSALRGLDLLSADPGWGLSLDNLPEAVIDERIDRQLTEAVGSRPPSSELPDLTDVREANGAPLRERLAVVQKLAIAWHRKNGPLRTDLGPDFVDTSMRALDSAGALDFVSLDDELLVAWMQRVGAWPDPMPLTIEPAALGLTDADLVEATTQRDAAREERLKAERRVTVHGSAMDLDPSMANLITRLTNHLASSPASLSTPYRFTTPQTLTERGRGRGSGERRSTSSGARPRRLSDAQRDAIGLAGELTAFHWLRAKARSPVDETCWKSTYVSYVYEGSLGDDSLGYDFAVPRAGGSSLYEVKATSGDASMIELGESEVACAQEHARSGRWRLLIVEEVLSTAPRVLMLPNPFGRDSRSLYSFVGNSVRLRFRL